MITISYTFDQQGLELGSFTFEEHEMSDFESTLSHLVRHGYFNIEVLADESFTDEEIAYLESIK